MVPPDPEENMRKTFSFIAALAICLAGLTAASAQTYPSRPITMVIPFAAGGPTDILGRLGGQRMGEVLGQQALIQNVGGAGGTTGRTRVAPRAPDGNTVKAIALMNSTRSPALPNVPTTVEQGLANAEAYTWNAIFLPKNAPDAIVKKLNDAALQAMHSALVKERLEGLGAQIVPDDRATPAYLGNFVKSEIEKWPARIKARGATRDG